MRVVIVSLCLFYLLRELSITHGLVLNQVNIPVSSRRLQQRQYHSSFYMAAHPSEKEKSSSWYKMEDLDSLSSHFEISGDDLLSHHLDTTFYGTSTCYSDETNSAPKIEPLFVRLRPESKLHSKESEQPNDQFLKSSGALLSLYSEEITRAENAAAATYRWCSNFVKKFELCPWAKQSLMSENAIRIKVIGQSHGLDAMERVVRESAIELKHLTESGLVDPYIGISFVVSVPDSEIVSSTSGSNCDEKDFDFVSFYEFSLDLEETLLDEVSDDDTADASIGDYVTIAPFHPDWSFASSDGTNEDPVNYEKRTPYPTISVVMSEGIDLAGEEMTSRIGLHNEKVLREMGTDALKHLYNTNVLVEPVE